MCRFVGQATSTRCEHICRVVKAEKQLGTTGPVPFLSPNHWHFVVQPNTDTQVTEFFRWMTHTHTMRWHAYYHTEGTGHLYQGRFKTFPIEEDEHLRSVLRYVERNALCRRVWLNALNCGNMGVCGELLTATMARFSRLGQSQNHEHGERWSTAP